MDNPRPDVVMDQFGASSVVLTLRFWIDDPTIQRKWQAQNAVVEAVKRAFEREGIKIPYPQRELSGRDETDGLRIAPTRAVPRADDGDSTSQGDGDEDRTEDSEETDTPDAHRAAVDGGSDDETTAEEDEST